MDVRLIEAQKAFDEGRRLLEGGQFPQAVPLVDRALEPREAVLGGTHPAVAICLMQLGHLHRTTPSSAGGSALH